MRLMGTTEEKPPSFYMLVGYTEWKREKLHVSSDRRLFIFKKNHNGVFRRVNCCVKKLIYEIYHVYGLGKRSVFTILGINAFSGNEFLTLSSKT